MGGGWGSLLHATSHVGRCTCQACAEVFEGLFLVGVLVGTTTHNDFHMAVEVQAAHAWVERFMPGVW